MSSRESIPIVARQQEKRRLLAEKGEKNDIGNDDISHYSPETIYRNFYAMSIAFALNHGCVVSCLAYASAELGNNMGSVGSGILYIFFAVTAFFFSKPLVTMMGPKISMLVGVIGYCVYVCGFLFAVVSRLVAVDVAWAVSCISAAIGGIAGGLLWTAQGRYFSTHAKLYAECLNVSVEKVNAIFAGIFATAFLGTEMFTKLIATFLFVLSPQGAPFLVFSLYTAIAIVSSFIVAALDDLDDKGTWDISYNTVSHDAGAAARLVYVDHRMKLLVPFQIAFGFASSFVPFYIFGTVIADSPSLGTSYVGVLSAIIVLVGAATAIPLAWAANVYGKRAVIVVGGFCLALTGFVLFLIPNSVLGTWYVIVPYLIVYGIGRGTWENTNKAVIADFFSDSPDSVTAAFAATTFFNGYASAMGYFTFSSVSRLDMAGVVMISSIIGIITYMFAFRYHDKIVRERNEELNKVDTRKQDFLSYAARLTSSSEERL